MGAARHSPRRKGAGKSIDGLDTIRGLFVVLMTLFHLGYDLYFYSGMPAWILSNPLMTAFQIISSWGFILLAGVTSRLSRSNIRRGVLVLCCGAAASVVTYLWGDFVRFGILQFLGCSMLLYGMTHRLWEALPRWVAPVLYLLLFALSRAALPVVMEVPHLYPIGIITPTFRAPDYFPLFPWFFWFLFGTWLGGYVRQGKMPAFLAGLRVRPLTFLGRHALAAYFIHQPVLLGLSSVIALLTGYDLPF